MALALTMVTHLICLSLSLFICKWVRTGPILQVVVRMKWNNAQMLRHDARNRTLFSDHFRSCLEKGRALPAQSGLSASPGPLLRGACGHSLHPPGPGAVRGPSWMVEPQWLRGRGPPLDMGQEGYF